MKKLLIAALVCTSSMAHAVVDAEDQFKECKANATFAELFAEYRDIGVSEKQVRKEVINTMKIEKHRQKATKIAHVVFLNPEISPTDFYEKAYETCVATMR